MSDNPKVMVEHYKDLTREKILAMEAGRELDVLVAEMVFGWKVVELDNGHGYPAPYYSSDGEKKDKLVNFWHPSRDVKDAWEVESRIKKLFEVTDHLIIQRYMAELWLIVGGGEFEMVHATAEQRSKAALLAVMNL